VWEILSLARHTFRESVRKKVMLVAALYVVVVLVASSLAPIYYPEARVELALWKLQNLEYVSLMKKPGNLPAAPEPADAADALAVAICHHQAARLRGRLRAH
jgi:crossover junction endodeoxyribonuclease RuvC